MSSAAHDTQITVDGDLYFVRRDFDLMRRIEQAFGPLTDLDKMLRRNAVTVENISKLYGITLHAQRSRPEADVIQTHIANAGVMGCCADLAQLVLMLFAGHRQATAWLDAEAKAKANEVSDTENPPLPV